MRAPSRAYVREIQVGLFVLLACIIVAAFSLRLTDSPVFRRGTALTLYLNDATGIFKASKVKMAGINIGIIQSIKLENGQARIDILIDRGINIPKDSQIVPRPLGILGDKYLEVVVPTDSKTGITTPQSRNFKIPSFLDWWIESANAEDDQIASTEPKVEITPEPIPSPSDSPSPAMTVVPARAQPKSKVQRVYRQGEVVKSVDSAVTLDDLARKMGNVSEDLKDISSNLKGLIRNNQNEITQMIHSMNRIVQKVEKSINAFDEKQIEKDLKRLSDSVGSFNNSVRNVESITAKVDRGEGTLGKLINDPTIANELSRTLSTINSVVEKARRTLTIVDMSSEYAVLPRVTKTYLGLTIMPREDTAYIGQAVIDPGGTIRKKVITTTPLGGTPATEEIVTNDRDALKYSLQFMKRVYNLGVRIGLFESRGGAGLDYYFFHDNLKLTTELFDWSREGNSAHLKVGLQFKMLNYFYVTAGGDDLLSKPQGDFIRPSFYAGIGLRFTDEDLKTLLVLRSVP